MPWWHMCLCIKSHTLTTRFKEPNTGLTWVLSAPGGPHVGPMNLAFWGIVDLVWPIYVGFSATTVHNVSLILHWVTSRCLASIYIPATLLLKHVEINGGFLCERRVCFDNEGTTGVVNRISNLWDHAMSTSHDDVMTWRCFPYYLAL